MISMRAVLVFAHLIGLALAIGAATAKLVLLLRCRVDPDTASSFVAVRRPITHVIIGGLMLATLSGVGFLWLGYPMSSRLTAKVVLVVAVWALGPVIDKVVEPAFVRLAPAQGEAPSEAFLAAGRRYLFVESIATGLFYVIVAMWVLP